MTFKVSKDQNTITIIEDSFIDEYSFMAGARCNKCAFKIESNACMNAPCVSKLRGDGLSGCFVHKNSDYDDGL